MNTRPLRQTGVTLIELMVSLVIGLVLVGAIGSVFVGSARSYRENERHAQMQDELRFAMSTLVWDLEMAGHWAQLLDPTRIRLDGSLNDPGCSPPDTSRWGYSDRDALAGLDNATVATIGSAFPCIRSADLAPNTDVVSIKRVAGRPGIAGSGAFLRTNGVVGTLFLGTAPIDEAAAVPAPFQDWAYEPSIYFIRNYSVAAGDGIPNLCRRILQGETPSYTTECLAEGIEDLQLEYAVDTRGDGTAIRFVHQPTAVEFGRVMAVRVSLLARSVQPLPHYSNGKTYRLANAPLRSPGDAFYRRAAQITVQIRNPTALRRLLEQ